MSPDAATRDTGYENLIKKQSDPLKGKTVEARNIMKCAALNTTKRWV